MEQRRKIFGPYQHGQRWRVFVGFPGGRRVARSYTTREEAEAAAQLARFRLEGEGPQLVSEALASYEIYLREKGNKPGSITCTMDRMERFLGGEDKKVTGTLKQLTAARCQSLYSALSSLAVDTHRNMLSQAKTFGAWLVAQKWLKSNPFAEIKGIGRRRHGKEQLRIDEARRWLAHAHERAKQGQAGAIAALLALLVGLRASEIVGLTVRDVDDGGALLWVSKSKTEAGRRRVRVPMELRGYLLGLRRDKLPLAQLFGQHWRDWPRKWVQRICRAARVPEVSAHGMRGLHATLAMEAGQSGDTVARALGHTSAAITRLLIRHTGSRRHRGPGSRLRRIEVNSLGNCPEKRSYQGCLDFLFPEYFRGAVGDRTPGL